MSVSKPESDGGLSLLRYYFGQAGLLPSLETSTAGMFYREVLLTYRLLFGQHKRSWKLCRETGGLYVHDIRSWRTLWLRRRGNKGPDGTADTVDSLLDRLCAPDCSREQLYDDVGAPDVRSVYSAQQDFPFFGDRLIALQEYVRFLGPTDFRSLFYDRRDLTKFFGFFTVMVFGITTLLLSIMAVALAAGQIAGMFRTGNYSVSLICPMPTFSQCCVVTVTSSFVTPCHSVNLHHRPSKRPRP